MESVELTEIPKMKVAELKTHLKDRDLPITGNKSELVLRLEESVTGTGDISQEEDELLGDQAEDELLDTTSKPEEKTENAPAAPTETITPDPVVQTPADEPAADSLQKVEIKAPQPLTDAEKAAKRAEKFGIVQEEDAKAKRAARFGIVSDDEKKAARATKFGGVKDESKSPVVASATLDAETLTKRQARFGVVEAPTTNKLKGGKTNTAIAELSEEEKAKALKRKERFGEVTSPKLAKVVDDEKLSKRQDRFGAIAAPVVVAAEDEDKKKKRSGSVIRFQEA